MVHANDYQHSKGCSWLSKGDGRYPSILSEKQLCVDILRHKLADLRLGSVGIKQSTLNAGASTRQQPSARWSLPLPCRCHAVTMPLPCRPQPLPCCYHDVAMPLPCRYHAVTTPLPCRSHAVSMLLPCCSHAFTMPSPCR